jgi:hypothetical protein
MPDSRSRPDPGMGPMPKDLLTNQPGSPRASRHVPLAFQILRPAR